MLTKNQHPRMNYISRLLALPLLVFVFGAFTVKVVNNIENGSASKKVARKITVVLDAGHGGKDAGVTNKNGVTEKDLALQLVKKIKALNDDENIEIILTRDNDVYADPRTKAEFAKNNNADLFISVHLDNTPKANWNSVSGMNVFVARDGVSNVEKSKILGAVILNTFKENYELPVPSTIVQRQVGVWIIQANTFPSILIEAGYLTNDKDAAYLLSNKGQEAFAKNVLNSIKQYASANLNAVNIQNNIQPQSDSSIYYKGKKVKTYSVSVNTKENKITGVKLFFYDNTTKTITAKEAYLIGVEIPPVSNDGNLAAKEIPLYLSDSIKRNNESVNLIKKAFEDSADVIYLLDGKQIRHEEGSKIVLDGPNDIQVYDADAAFKTFGIKTKRGLLNILTKRKTQINDKVFTQVEVEPEFPGGKDAWRKFLQTNLDGSIAVKEELKVGSYSFITKFIVHEDGSLSDFTSEKNINDTIAKHCIEVIKKGPKWKPAMQNGNIVSAYRKQPITFVVANE